MKTYFTVYKVTNQTNNKFYIGVHKTQDPFDEYIGSGHNIRKAIRKYGSAAFTKEILFYGFSEDDAYWFESIVVNKEFLLQENAYNINLGGNKPPSWKGKFHSEETKQKMRKPKSNTENYKGKSKSEETKRKISNKLQGHPFWGNQVQSDETKVKVSLAKKGKPRSASFKLKMKDSTHFNQRLTCIYCGAESNAANIKRWHDTNCKTFTAFQ